MGFSKFRLLQKSLIVASGEFATPEILKKGHKMAMTGQEPIRCQTYNTKTLTWVDMGIFAPNGYFIRSDSFVVCKIGTNFKEVVPLPQKEVKYDK